MHVGRLVVVPRYRWIDWFLDTDCQAYAWIQAGRLIPGGRLSKAAIGRLVQVGRAGPG
jgi:hypothetical protein